MAASNNKSHHAKPQFSKTPSGATTKLQFYFITL